MRGMIPFIAFAIVGTYGLMVLVGLVGVAYGGYCLINSDFSLRRGSNSRSQNMTSPPLSPPNYNTNANANTNTNANAFRSPSLPGNYRPSSSPAFNPPPMPHFDNPPPPPPSFPGSSMNPRFGKTPGAASSSSEGLDVNSNSNLILKKFADRLRVSASSEWQGWPARHAIDGNPNTSWFPTTMGDVTEGPWILLTFPDDTPVRRVTILGNRDSGKQGYHIARLRIDFLDSSDKVLRTIIQMPTKGHDFDATALALLKVRKIRVTSLEDSHAMRGRTQQVGIGEIQVE